MLITAMADVSVGSQCFPPKSGVGQLPVFMQEELMLLRTFQESKTSRFHFSCKY